MKTKIEIIKETLKYYKTHRRALLNNICTYLSPTGSMCAVGRCIDNIKELKNTQGTIVNENIGADSLNMEELDNILKSEYRGHDRSFWIELQNFHDYDSHWESNGRGNILTEHGKEYYNRLLKKYEEEPQPKN